MERLCWVLGPRLLGLAGGVGVRGGGAVGVGVGVEGGEGWGLLRRRSVRDTVAVREGAGGRGMWVERMMGQVVEVGRELGRGEHCEGYGRV